MRRSFGSGGNGMGGGSGGPGSSMIRTVQRAVRAGVGAETFSSSTPTNSRKANTTINKKNSIPPNTALTLSSCSGVGVNGGAFSSLINFPVAATWGSCSSPTRSDDFEWECVESSENEREHLGYDEFLFGTAPSSDEVNHAVSALQSVIGESFKEGVPNGKFMEGSSGDLIDGFASPTSCQSKVSCVETELDWVEPSLELCNTRSERVYDAFHLLQTEPSVQRMVISLSSDKAVWDAVLNNEAVKEIRGSIEELGERTDEELGDLNPVQDIMSWVIVNAKAKITELIEKIAKLVNEVFQSGNKEEKNGGFTVPFEDKMKTSLFLSVIVLLIVVVTRAQSA